MDWLQLIILSLVQGITEFLPVSSSAHLILVPSFSDWPDQGLAFDVAVHLGTLLAVVLYFRRQLGSMSLSCLSAVTVRYVNQESRLVGLIALATLPVIIAGAIFHDDIASRLRSPLVITFATIIFGLALLWANRTRPDACDEYQISIKIALMIGLAQALALIPGTSRSGITMTAAILLGMSQTAAARFSFLLAIPVILASTLFEIVGLVRQPEAVEWWILLAGVLLSGISALLCIHLFLRFIERVGFTPFVIYRLILGCILLAVV